MLFEFPAATATPHIRRRRSRAACTALVRLLTLVVLLVRSGPLVAQSDGAYRGYAYDSTFYLGASNIPDIGFARDTLHVRFSQIYSQYLGTVERLLDRTFADSAYDPRARRWTVADSVSARRDSVRKEQFVLSRRPGFGLIYTPARFSEIVDWCRTADHFLAGPSDMYFTELRRGSNAPGEYRWADDRHLWRGFRLDSSSSGPVCMALRPRFTAGVMNRSDFWYYDTVYHVSKDPARRAADSALRDSSGYFGVYFTLRVEGAGEIVDSSELDETIAYAVLYRRVRDGQRGYTPGARYRGNIYAMIDTFRITRRMLVVPALHRDEGNGYVTVHTFVRLDTFAGLVRADKQFVYSDPVLPYFGPGDPGASDTSTDAGRGVHRVFDSLRSAGIIPADSYFRDPYIDSTEYDFVEGSDFHYRFFTTRRLPVTFLRGRVANHLYSLLEEGRLDTLIRNEVAAVYSDARLRDATFRFGLIDEAFRLRIRPLSLMSRRVARFIDEFSPGDERAWFWVNPQSAFEALRILSNDLDSNDRKILPTVVRQSYPIGIIPFPITYMNPDSLGDFALGPLLKFDRPDAMSGRLIAVNDMKEYRAYDAELLRRFGSVADMDDDDPFSPTNTKLFGPWVPSLARAVDVSRFKYRRRPETAEVPSNPVWSVVQVFGVMGGILEGRYDGTFIDHRYPTPEEIIMQSWLSVACGVSGIVFADCQYDGYTIGLMGAYSKERDVEYGTMYEQDAFAPPADPGRRIDSIWLGLRSRTGAVREVCDELYRIDTLIGWKNLIYDQEQMSLFDSRRDFGSMPLLDTVVVERARHYDSVFAAYDPPRYDPHDSAYMEITRFRGAKDGADYLLFVNRRCWPIDFRRYGPKATAHGGGSVGLGNIDVRRPVVLPEVPPGRDADSVRIERIGGPDPWSRTARPGEPLPLQWLRPGRGALYRMTWLPVGGARD